jgi:hypothetical protein
MNIRNELNKQGYKIRRTHYRRLRGVKGEFRDYAIRELNLGKQIEPTGGRTLVRLTTPSGARSEAVAFCCETDCYNRKEGVKLALRRAVEALESEKPDLSFLD